MQKKTLKNVKKKTQKKRKKSNFSAKIINSS